MKVTVHFRDTLMGALAEVDGRVLFKFAAEYLSSGLPSPSPLHLPLRADAFACERIAMLRLPGCCYDSLPDAWGDRIAERWFQAQHSRRSLDFVRPLERLCVVGDRGVGALTFAPDLLADADPRARTLGTELDLRRMESSAQSIRCGDAIELTHLVELTRAGMVGGARPKAWVSLRDSPAGLHVVPGDRHGEGFTAWLLKFDLQDQGQSTDETTTGRVEHAYAQMAKAAGLRTAPTRLLETTDAHGGRRTHFAIRGFDRTDQGERVHFHSLAGMLERDFAEGRIDYRDLFATTARLTADAPEELLEVFRRLAFNVAACVRDDHGKNHGFLRTEHAGRWRWRLSPAYDLVFTSPAHLSLHAMPAAGRCTDHTTAHLLALAEENNLPRAVALEALDRVRAAVARWPEFAAQAGVAPEQAATIGAALPGLSSCSPS